MILGRCHWSVSPIVIEIWMNNAGEFTLNTMVHEFFHAAGYGHAWEINGWANFGRGNGKDRNRFITLIVRDLTGKDTVIL